MKYISTAWRWLVDWFEKGDLVPVMVLVSAYHYAAVLSGKDALPVAVAIGLLVDLGHYRTIRAAVRYNGDWRQAAARWAIAGGMTALSLNYHQRYYADWWLSAPLPLLIAALAWLQHVDRNATKQATKMQQDATSEQPQRATIAKQPKIEQPPATETTRERVLRLHHEQPQATHAQLAEMVSVSRQQVSKYIASNGYKRK